MAGTGKATDRNVESDREDIRDHRSEPSVPRFDPICDRDAMQQRARTVAREATGEGGGWRRGEYDGREDAFEAGYSGGYELGYTDGFQAGLDARPGIGDRFEWDPATIGDATGRGASLAFVVAILATIGYYGATAIRAGTTELGGALPMPVYWLAFALLFALALVRHLRDGVAGLLFAAVFSIALGILTMFAVEGSLVLVEDPSIATDDAAIAAVFAGALLVSFVGYWAILSVVEWDTRKTARANAMNRARSYSSRSR